MPWPEVIAAAREAETRWLILERESDPAHALRHARRGLVNLERLLAGAVS